MFLIMVLALLSLFGIGFGGLLCLAVPFGVSDCAVV